MTAERTRFLFDYDPPSGLLRRRRHANRNSSYLPLGEAVGHMENSGYLRISIDGRRYLIHKIVWLHFYGEWPKNHIDHVDGNRSNNRIANLRLATPSQNSANKKTNNNNVLGCKGVKLHKQTGKYHARIYVGGVTISLGLHHKMEDAARAYANAAKIHFGEFARLS